MTRPTDTAGPLPVTSDARRYWVRLDAIEGGETLDVYSDGVRAWPAHGGEVPRGVPRRVVAWAPFVRGQQPPRGWA